MANRVFYDLLIRKSRDADFGPGTLVAHVENMKNLGYAEYANDVPEMFFTVLQKDPKVKQIREAEWSFGDFHAQLYRNGELMWAGLLGESSETQSDIVFTAHGYIATLFWNHTDWDETWEDEDVSTVVDDIWTEGAAKDEALNEWMTKGTIENPVTTSGGSTGLQVGFYRANYKRRLFVLREMAALAISDTTNRVYFEVSPSGVFTFRKNWGSDVDTARWGYGVYGSQILAFSNTVVPADRRTTIFGVGASPRDTVLRKTVNDTGFLADTMGRREEAVFFSYVRDETELDRVTRLRLARAKRLDKELSLTMLPGSVLPFRATGSGWKLTDGVKVMLNHGGSYVNEHRVVVGQQVVYVAGREVVRVLQQDRL